MIYEMQQRRAVGLRWVTVEAFATREQADALKAERMQILIEDRGVHFLQACRLFRIRAVRQQVAA